MAQPPAAAAAALAARIDRLPASGPIWSWVAKISFGAFFEIYETALTSLMAPLLMHVGIFHKGRGGFFGLPDLATFAFATFGGLFAGVLLFSAISDRYGRRAIFTWSLLGYAAATLVMAMQTTAFGICLWRFIAAIGVGAEIIAVDSYLAELMPKSMRGRGFAISKSIQYSAVPLASILAALLARHAFGGIDGWRMVLLVPAVGAALIWWVRRGLPESPRWLVLHGRAAEAEQVVTNVEDAIRRTGRTLPDPAALAATPETPVAYADLFRAPLRRRMIMMVIASCFGSIAYYGFNNWLPSLLEARGVEITKTLVYSALIAIAYPLAPLAFSLIADRYERKWQIVVGAAVVAVSGLAFAGQTTAAGWIACGLLVSIGNNLSSYATHTYRSELFPTGVRGRAIGLVYSADRLVTAFNSYMIAWLLVTVGVTGVLTFITAASLVNMTVIGLFGPRTRGLSSEEVVNTRPEGIGLAPLQPEA